MKITVTMTLDTHNPADAVIIDEMLAESDRQDKQIDLEMDELVFHDAYPLEDDELDEEYWWEDEDELEGDLW